jgi:hypothetical protein
VTLGADIAANLPFLREQAESMMLSRCIIRRRGERVLSEVTGQYEVAFTTVYEGPCKFRVGGTQPSESDAQSQRLVEQASRLDLPVLAPGSADVQTNDVAELTVNPLDPALVGTLARIAVFHAQSFATARRFPVEVVTDAGSE